MQIFVLNYSRRKKEKKTKKSFYKNTLIAYDEKAILKNLDFNITDSMQSLL